MAAESTVMFVIPLPCFYKYKVWLYKVNSCDKVTQTFSEKYATNYSRLSSQLLLLVNSSKNLKLVIQRFAT